jgi:hypothetical protein
VTPDVIERADVRVTQPRNGASLPLKALARLRCIREVGREDFYRQRAVEPRVSGTVDFSHPARTERCDDFVGS